MNDEELKLYNILFPNDNNPSFINYGYFTGGSTRTLAILKARIRESCIAPVLIEDDVNEGSFFIKIEQKDIDIFLNTIKSLKYREKKLSKRCMNRLKALFADIV